MSDILIISFLFLAVIVFVFYRYIQKIRKAKILTNMKSSYMNYIELLENNGYKLIKSNCAVELATSVDERLQKDTYKLPLIVSKRGIKYIVHIKKRSEDTLRLNKNTRQYFFSLCVLFNADGVLMIDNKNKRIKNIVFNNLKDRKKKTVVLILILNVVIIFMLIYILYNFYM